MKSAVVIALGAVVVMALGAQGCAGRKNGSAPNAEIVDAGASEVPQLSANDDEGFDLPVREEIRQKRVLTTGKEVFIVGVRNFRVDTDNRQVFVIGIDGRVKVETADTDYVEILIVRSARTREDLLRQEVEINPNDNNENLLIRVGDRDSNESRRSVARRTLKAINVKIHDNSAPEPVPEIRHRVVLRMPRKAGLEIRDIGGEVTVSDLSGHLKIASVTGNIRVSRGAGPIDIDHSTGDVDITFKPLGSNGIEIGDINGDIDLRIDGDSNADLNAFGVNGFIKHEFPIAETRVNDQAQGRLKARIGNGGLGIKVQSVNGNLTLSNAANGAANGDPSSVKAAAK